MLGVGRGCLTSIHMNIIISGCLNYEKEKKVELETMGIKAPIILKVLLFT
jgi:hypothetical protein